MSTATICALAFFVLAFVSLVLIAYREDRRRRLYLATVDPIFPHMTYPVQERDLHQRCMFDFREIDGAPRDDGQIRPRICWSCSGPTRSRINICCGCIGEVEL